MMMKIYNCLNIMRTTTILLSLMLAVPLAAQEMKIAVVGLVHSHVWGHLNTMLKGESARLVGVAEPNPDLIGEAKRRGVTDDLVHSDYKRMLETVKPDSLVGYMTANRSVVANSV